MTQERQPRPMLAEPENENLLDEYVPLKDLPILPLEEVQDQIRGLLEMASVRNNMVPLAKLAARMFVEPIQILETIDHFLRQRNQQSQTACLKILARINRGSNVLHYFRVLKQASKRLGNGRLFMSKELAEEAGVTPDRVSDLLKIFGRGSRKHFGLK